MRKSKRTWHRVLRCESDVTPLMRVWILRMLVPLGGHRKFVQSNGFADDDLAQLLGFGKWIEPKDGEFKSGPVRSELRRLHRTAEHGKTAGGIPPLLNANVAGLGNMVGLDQVSRQILAFIILVKNESVLDDAADMLGGLTSLKAIKALSVILGFSEAEVRRALAPQSPLAQSGLLQVNRDDTASLGLKFQLLSEGFADLIASLDGEPIQWLQSSVRLSAPGELEQSDYVHLSRSLTLLTSYLRQALASRRPGVNVLLYGEPGTGKNQLAKLMARELGCELFEVASEDGDGDSIDGEGRLRAFRAAQCIFANRTAFLLFDEVEDVFDDASALFGRKSLGQTRKAWVNRMLEENPVPAFWLTNSVDCLDPAFIRRFDMVIELPVPPRSRRKAIIEKACGGMLDERAAERLAASDVVTPAIVSRAASVVRSVEGRIAEQDAGPALELLVGNTLKAQGHTPPKGDADRLPETYDPQFINADIDLAALARGRGPAGSASMGRREPARALWPLARARS